MQEYTTFFIIKKFGFNRSTFKQWMDRGFLRPSIATAEGQGTKNLFSREDLYSINAFRNLSDLGIPQFDASLVAYKIPWDQVEPDGIVFVNIHREIIGNASVATNIHFQKDVDIIQAYEKDTGIVTSIDGQTEDLRLGIVPRKSKELWMTFNALATKIEVDSLLE